MTAIKAQHEAANELALLLHDWACRPHHHHKAFIGDGVVDWDRWDCQRRVLFVLKEAYGDGDDQNGWNLCDVIRDYWKGPKYRIWHRIAQWAHVIHSNPDLRLSTWPTLDQERDALMSSAVVNVKKSGGTASSNSDDLALYFEKDADLLLREIDLIRPHFIVFGGTWPLVKSLWSGGVQEGDRIWKLGSAIGIEFWHPSNQFPNALNFYAFASLAGAAVRVHDQQLKTHAA